MKKLTALLLVLLLLLTACQAPENPDDGACRHADDNNDGICDLCYGSVQTLIDFYAINDIHGKFADSESNIGVDELSTYLKKRKKQDEYSIFLSSGDTWQGSSESNLTGGAVFTEWMNYLGFAAMTLGNHEFDWGEEAIEKQAALAEFPFLAINIFEKETNQPVSYAKPSVTVDCGDITVGIIGAIGDCYSSISADKTADIYFKTGIELTSLVKEESKRLREAGADLIVYSLHDGYGSSKSYEQSLSSKEFSSYYDTALSRGGYVDLVFEGHTHQNYVLKDPYGVYHLQGGGENKGISHVEISVNSANGKVAVEEADYVKNFTYGISESDPEISKILENYRDLIAKGDEVLGVNGSLKKSYALCDIVASLYYEKGMAAWGDRYQIALAGAFMQTRSPYDLAAGEVTYAELMSIFPFNNVLKLCSIKGSDLKRVFYETTNKSYYIYFGPYGEELRGQIDDNATYYVITDSYSSTYAYNRMTEVESYDDTLFARDFLAEYIKNGNMA